eukprot:247096_1
MGENVSTTQVHEPVALRCYTKRRKIQDTLQGHIYLLTNEEDNGTYLPPIIIKKTSKELVKKGISRQNCTIAENYHEELRILSHLSSLQDVENYGICRIIKNYVWNDDENYYYGMQYCDGGDLFEYLRKTMPTERCIITRMNRAKMHFKQLVRAVYYLHSHGIAHRDISLENTMLYDKHGTILKLIDFGVAYDIRKHNYCWISHERVGKLNYMAPELFLMHKKHISYDVRAADIWALGCTLFLMLCGYPLFEHRNKRKRSFGLKCIEAVLRKQLHHFRMFDVCVADEIIDLLNRIFKYQNERIAMDELLNHPFVGLNNELEIINTYDDVSMTAMEHDTHVSQSNRFIILNRVMFREENNYF